MHSLNGGDFMFATVECRDAPTGIKGFMRDIFTLPEISFERV